MVIERQPTLRLHNTKYSRNGAGLIAMLEAHGGIVSVGISSFEEFKAWLTFVAHFSGQVSVKLGWAPDVPVGGGQPQQQRRVSAGAV